MKKRGRKKDPSWRPEKEEESDDDYSIDDDDFFQDLANEEKELLNTNKTIVDLTSTNVTRKGVSYSTAGQPASVTPTMTNTAKKRVVSPASCISAAPRKRRKQESEEEDPQEQEDENELAFVPKEISPTVTFHLAEDHEEADKAPEIHILKPLTFFRYLYHRFKRIYYPEHPPSPPAIPALEPTPQQSTQKTVLLSNANDNNSAISAEPNGNGLGDIHEIDCKQLRFQQPVSSGSFGDVYKARWIDKDVAVKVLKNRSTDFLKEATILSKLKHPNIVEFYGACSEPYQIIVMEYVDGGSLHHFLHVNKVNLSNHFSLLVSFATDILQGLHFLHSQNIIHRDIKPANLLVDKNNHIKITDFGISREVVGSVMTGFVGTVLYMAPELMGGGARQKYDLKVDVYSFAIVLWEMISRQVPFSPPLFPMNNPINIVLHVKKGSRLPLPPTIFYNQDFTGINNNTQSSSDCSVEEDEKKKKIECTALNEMIVACWAKKPSARPNIPDLIAQLQSIAASN